MPNVPKDRSPAPYLPPGFELVADLSGDGRVLHARRSSSGVDVVVRAVEAGESEGDELRAELGVLASLHAEGTTAHTSAGLAAWVAHGFDEGHAWVARQWVEGVDLAAWCRGRKERDVALALARTSLAVAELHDLGFVHADLKVGNVLVESETGRVVLTDFGLARRSAEQGIEGAPSGTLFHVAPEVLHGAPLTPRADLFALGVLAHELLVGHRPSARDFYARFPEESFFEATESSPDELPEWARDLVASLLARDPGQRPDSAASAARALAARAGLDELGSEMLTEGAPRFSARRGRDAWFAELATAARSRTAIWVHCPAGENLLALEEALALELVLSGVRSKPVDLRAVDALVNELELDAWVTALCTAWTEGVHVARLSSATPWRCRALLASARALAAAQGAGPALVVLAHESSPDVMAFEPRELPGVTLATLTAAVDGWLPKETAERRSEFVAWLTTAAGARGDALAAARVESALAIAVEQGVLLRAAPWRLRPGALPRTDAVVETLDLRDASSGAQRLARLVALCPECELPSVEDVAPLLHLERAALGAAVNECVRRGALFTIPTRSGFHPAVVGVLTPPCLDVSIAPSEEGELRRAIAEALGLGAAGSGVQAAFLGTRPSARLPFALYVGLATINEVVAESRRLRDRGSPERALELCDRAQGMARKSGRAEMCEDVELHAERGFLWSVLGDQERALAEADWLDTEGDRGEGGTPLPRARALQVRARVAWARNELRTARDLFRDARTLVPEDPVERAQELRAAAQICFEEGRYSDVQQMVAEAPTEELEANPRLASSLRSLAAMSAFHTGDVDEARASLQRELDDAVAREDFEQQAATLLNLSTIERRSGELARAITDLERAVEQYERAGILRGAIQARAMLGGSLRESGQLERAVCVLSRALELRERGGDVSGALAVRGMLGLALADRGHVRTAITELETSAAGLAKRGRASAAELFAARAALEHARIGVWPEARSKGPGTNKGVDPRILVWRGYAAWLAGDVEKAQECSLGARERAVMLRQDALAAESLALHAALNRDSDQLEVASGSGFLANQDLRLVAWLCAVERDAMTGRRLYEELAASGRDDRAARVLFALYADETEGRARLEIAQALDSHAGRVLAGLASTEREALILRLCGRPDPCPTDIGVWPLDSRLDEEDDMQLITLFDINHRLLEQQDLDGLLETIVEHSVGVTNAERGFLVLEEGGKLLFDRALDSSRGDIDEPDLQVSRSIVTQALATMETQRVSNALDDPLLSGAPSVVQLELRSVLCAPFRVDDQRRGVVYVDHRIRTGAFTSRDQRVLGVLADQAGLAILQLARMSEIRELNERLSRRVVRRESDLQAAHQALRTAGLTVPASGLVGSSRAMQEVNERIERFARAALPVLVTGPSGSGKDLAARALHASSPRSPGPLVAENCAALPASLIEAELFGHRKGAFTGADQDRLGLFESADGGTLFLDEIGELPLELQAKLLRVLESGEVRRLGDTVTRNVDVRLVCATNRDLPTEVTEGRFRADLYYRLDGLTLRMPPLAERTEDIPELVNHLLRLDYAKSGRSRLVSSAVLRELCLRPWPGNVRELANEIARLCVLSDGDIDDPSLVRRPGPDTRESRSGPVVPLVQLEREAILQALEATNGDKSRAAELLGISRAKIYQRLKAWEEEGAS